MPVIDISGKKFEEKLKEFKECIDRAYEIFREFHEMKCVKCNESACTDNHREMEFHCKFLLEVFLITTRKLRERMGVSAHLLEGSLISYLQKHAIISYIESYFEELSKVADNSYIY